jgi:hypothetical protein
MYMINWLGYHHHQEPETSEQQIDIQNSKPIHLKQKISAGGRGPVLATYCHCQSSSASVATHLDFNYLCIYIFSASSWLQQIQPCPCIFFFPPQTRPLTCVSLRGKPCPCIHLSAPHVHRNNSSSSIAWRLWNTQLAKTWEIFSHFSFEKENFSDMGALMWAKQNVKWQQV